VRRYNEEAGQIRRMKQKKNKDKQGSRLISKEKKRTVKREIKPYLQSTVRVEKLKIYFVEGRGAAGRDFCGERGE
jgi:hypothetical protein